MTDAVLLDTHAWIWFVAGDESRFSLSSLKILRAAEAQDALVVSDISVWEVATKVGRGKLKLAPTLDDWLARAGAAPGLAYLPLDRQTLLLSTRLPGAIRRDPADRMIIAAAALNRLCLATADTALLDYASREKICDVLDVTR